MSAITHETSAYWYKKLYPNNEIIIVDPDGWDRQNYEYSWHEQLITELEFNRRLALSTIMFKKIDVSLQESGSFTEETWNNLPRKSE